ELPFDMARKRMSTIHAGSDGRAVIYCKGAPGMVLPLCDKVLRADGTTQELTSEQRDRLHKENERMADGGLRVLALATASIEGTSADFQGACSADLESHLTLLGLVGMYDPIKPGIGDAIAACQSAGIRVMMLTGDQPRTALAIAGQVGICSDEN